MSNIRDTEVAIGKRWFMGKPEGHVVRLAGQIGRPYLRLYPEVDLYPDMPPDAKPYIALELIVDRMWNKFFVHSTHPLMQARKGDMCILYFSDNTTTEIQYITDEDPLTDTFTGAGFMYDQVLNQLCLVTVDCIECIDMKRGAKMKFNFRQPNRMYTTEQDGQQLLQIVAEQLAAAKLMIDTGAYKLS